MYLHSVAWVQFCWELVHFCVCTQPTHLTFFLFSIGHPAPLSCSYADIPLPSSLGQPFLQRVHESAARMRLPVLSVTAADLNSGEPGFSAPLAVRVGAQVAEELHRLLRCTEDREDADYLHCCVVGEVCEIMPRENSSSSLNVDNSANSAIGSISSHECPPATFTMCAAQGWLCRSRPRVVWDRCVLPAFLSHFYLLALLFFCQTSRQASDAGVCIVQFFLSQRAADSQAAVGRNWPPC